METASSSIGSGRVKFRACLLTRHLMLSVFALLAGLAFAGQSFAQILGTGTLNVERRGHTATLLEDGKILIAGGENAQGPIGQAELFDPVSRTSALVPDAAAPRIDHTATRLADGRVLISGGRNQTGQMATTEIYDPLTGSFNAGPSMMRARSGHTATKLADGKILIAGGDAMGSAEIYDPAAQSFSLIAGSMSLSRTFHGAALLNNGQVLIAGGMDTQSVPLNTAEIYDPQSQGFYRTINDMGNPRAFALMRVLPDGKVQIIGGDSEFSMEVFDPQDGLFNGVALLPPNTSLLAATLSTASRAALISPEITQDAILQGVLTPEHLALLDRADHSITEIPQANQALVAGGLKSTGQVLSSATLVKSSSATITTDKTDYAPGEFVTITGAGFLPNEQVEILLHEFPDEYPDLMFSAVADHEGRFMVAEFAPQIIDIGRTFTLTATGISSSFTAQTAFTDGPRVDSVSVGGQSPNLVTVGNAATYTITIQRGTQAGSFTATLNITTTLPDGATASFSPSSASFSACTGPNASNSAHACNRQTATLSISTDASTPAGSTPFTVRAFVTNPNQPSDFAEGNGTLAIDAACPVPSITTNPSDQTVTYGNNATFTAAANGDPAPSVQWQLSTNSGASWSDISGAISTTLTVTAPSVAMSGNKYRALFTNNCSGTQTATTSAAILTVNKAVATVVLSDMTQTYTGSPLTPTATTTPSGLTIVWTGAPQTNAGSYPVTATVDDLNYEGSASGTFIINKANATIIVNGYTGMYDGLAHGATGSAVGVLGEDLSASLNLGDTFTTVPGGTAYWTFTGGTNYNDANGNVEIVITTAFAYSGFYPPIGGSVEYGNGGSYANPLKTFKLNSTIPVKFSATWLNGGAALITGIHWLEAIKYSNSTDSDPPIDATPTDAATTGNQFRLTGTDWHFNLSTKGLTAGKWLLRATLEDGSQYTVWITIKK